MHDNVTMTFRPDSLRLALELHQLALLQGQTMLARLEAVQIDNEGLDDEAKSSFAVFLKTTLSDTKEAVDLSASLISNAQAVLSLYDSGVRGEALDKAIVEFQDNNHRALGTTIALTRRQMARETAMHADS